MWPHWYIILQIITQCYFILLLKIAEKQFWYFFKNFGIFSKKPAIIFSNIFSPFSFIEGTICLLKVKVKSLSHVWLFSTPWTVAYQAPPSMGFSRQEYLNGLPFPSPGNLPDPGIEPGLPHCRQILYCLSHRGSLICLLVQLNLSGWYSSPLFFYSLCFF